MPLGGQDMGCGKFAAGFMILAAAAGAAHAQIAAGAANAQATPAAAEPVNLARVTLGYTYFNRPGADLATHHAAVAACLVEADKMQAVDEQMPSQGLLGALIQGAIADAAHRGVVAAALENCMVVRGWRVVHLADAEGVTLAALPAAELSNRLQAWVGAQTPHGDVVRVWGNDAANGRTVHFQMRPDHTNDGQLSLKVATENNLKQAAAEAYLHRANSTPTSVAIDPKWPKKPLKPGGFNMAPPEGGVIIIATKGLSFHNGFGLVFTRKGPDPMTAASTVDHGPDTINATIGLLFAKRQGNFFAFSVPAGVWRLDSQLEGLEALKFCLGSPSFEVKPGEVIYAGAFDLEASDIGPDLSLAPVQAWLAGQPAAASIKPAVYTNGSLGPCAPHEIYAIEFKGAPFEPGYVWGSQSAAAPAAAAPGPAPDGDFTPVPAPVAGTASAPGADLTPAPPPAAPASAASPAKP